MKKIIFNCVVLAAYGLFCGYTGASVERRAAQRACESDDTPLVVNGVEYLCLSQRHLQMIQRRRAQKET